MSVKRDTILTLAGLDLNGKTREELQSIFMDVLKEGIHGICASPYFEGQEPGTSISEEQIRQRMEIIRPYIGWIRSFSCTEGNEYIPAVAREYGLNTLVGAWLGTDTDINEEEVENVIRIAKDGNADVVAVGNEVMYRGDLTEDELLRYLDRVRTAVPDIPLGYVDAYYEFENRPRIVDACDVVLCNCYPFWEGCALEYSLLYMKDMYNRALKAGKGKRVIVTETGWPNKGESFHGAKPSYENAIKYFLNAQSWSKSDDIELFYFSSFDEAWKTGSEGDVGAHWGLWDKTGILKYAT